MRFCLKKLKSGQILCTQSFKGSSSVLHIQVTVAADVCSPLPRDCVHEILTDQMPCYEAPAGDWGRELRSHHRMLFVRTLRDRQQKPILSWDQGQNQLQSFRSAWRWLSPPLSLRTNTQLQSLPSQLLLSVFLCPNPFMVQILHFCLILF